MNEDRPLDAAHFLAMVERKRVVAEAMVDSRDACQEAWMASGYAVEFALKAYIIRSERLNAWPSRESRPELYVHDLRALFHAAGIDLSAVPKELRGAIRAVLDWERGHEYVLGRMSRAQAKSIKVAAFGEGGVIAWLSKM